MAKTNKLKLVVNFIEAEIMKSEELRIHANESECYFEAGGFKKYIEGLEKALSYVKVIDGKDKSENLIPK